MFKYGKYLELTIYKPDYNKKTKKAKLKIKQNDTISDDCIYVNSMIVSEIVNTKESKLIIKPWKNRIVKIKNKKECNYSIYKTVIAGNRFGVEKNDALLSFGSARQLGLENEDKIILKLGNQILYRHMFYYNHLNDSVRMSYKVGFYGLIFGVLGFAATIFTILSK